MSGEQMELQAFQKRVVDEKQQLDIRIQSLKVFINHSNAYKSVSVDEQLRLGEQLRYMEKYSGVLGDRIAAF